jgi:iron uptake system component EfeO
MGRRGWQHALFVLAASACTETTDAEYRADVDVAVHGSIGDSIAELVQATRDLQAASPAHTWRPETTDAAAITAMRDDWKRTRFAYEQIEGAIKAVFPALDTTMDARYEESLAALGDGGDRNPFDGRGVIGMHAIERILFAPVTRPEVITYECSLPGYKPAAYPSTDDEAIAFKTGLVQRLIDDGDSLAKQWRKAEIDLNAAYRGQVSMMLEQQDKVNLAAIGEEESRYANITLADLRNNLDGTQNIYGLFRGWILSKAAGGSSDSKIQARFDELATIYLAGDALPDIPPEWAVDHPTPENLATPFGMMWQTIHESVDPDSESSVVSELNQIASLLDLTASPRP